jgi:hypothetical protein
VVYAGAAPGDHIPELVNIFREYKFILFDPHPFCDELRDLETQQPERVHLVQDFFNLVTFNNLGNTPSPHRFLFISDVRSSDVTKDADNNNAVVQRDMHMQMDWIIAIRPLRSMVKFRMPFPHYDGYGERRRCVNRLFPYLGGDIYLPIWAPRGSAECRLITVPYRTAAPTPPMKTYDCCVYEEQLMYFNHHVRADSNYDQRAETMLCRWLEIVCNLLWIGLCAYMYKKLNHSVPCLPRSRTNPFSHT